jgi:thiol-disulfide isomerase/thioredoxin
MSMHQTLLVAASVTLTVAAGSAQVADHDQLARGRSLWNQRLAKSAIAALDAATHDKAAAAAAHEELGRIYTFKGWQQESVFPGWHDEPLLRTKAIAELKASLAADPNRASAQEALKTAEGLAAMDKVDPAPPQERVKSLDEELQREAADTTTPIPFIEKTIQLRTMAQADPAPYFVGAQILIDRGEYDKAISWAERGAKASDHFVDENYSAYQMSGKAQSQLARGHATAADLEGWTLFLKKDYTGAAPKLEEAERLSQGLDFGNQFHLAELASAQHQNEKAREHYLNALSLSGGPAPLRQRATQAVAALDPAGSDPATFEQRLETALAERQAERKSAALKSLVDKPLPALALTTVDGKPFDASALRGKVVLVDFFASWCGICRQELPHLKSAYAKYQNDPKVTFLLVSIDEDSKRLERYLTEMKFPFAVARLAPERAEKAMGFDNVPWTFYVDRQGVVRYQTNGSEAHGDSDNRVSWYIDQLER